MGNTNDNQQSTQKKRHDPLIQEILKRKTPNTKKKIEPKNFEEIETNLEHIENYINSLVKEDVDYRMERLKFAMKAISEIGELIRSLEEKNIVIDNSLKKQFQFTFSCILEHSPEEYTEHFRALSNEVNRVI